MNNRNTIQKKLVLDGVRALSCHASAEEIYAFIIETHPTISRATVYRNLKQLSEAGEIRKIEIPGAPDRYDHEVHRHYHVHCVECGRVFDVDMELMDGIMDNIRDSHGFEFTGYDIVFKGVCPECQSLRGDTQKGETEN